MKLPDNLTALCRNCGRGVVYAGGEWHHRVLPTDCEDALPNWSHTRRHS